MKKIVLFCLFGISMLTMVAQKPVIPLMQAFDGRYYKEEGVSITEITQPSNYYYAIDVEGNKKIINQLVTWFKATEEIAENVTRRISNGNYNVVLNIGSDPIINIGAKYPDDLSEIRIFLQSCEPFK